MKIVEKEFSVSSGQREQMIDITSQVQLAVEEADVRDGDLTVFCPHTTAAITINENADKDVCHDVLLTMGEVIVQDRSGYRHCEGNSDSHCKSSLFGCSEQVLVKDGRLRLGTWQGVFFCEFDGPRNRKVIVQIRGE